MVKPVDLVEPFNTTAADTRINQNGFNLLMAERIQELRDKYL